MNFKLRRLADKKGPDEEDFNKLAASLDEFISRLFDPLKSGGRLRDVFLSDSIDNVMDAAIEFKQKNVSGNYFCFWPWFENWRASLPSLLAELSFAAVLL